MSKIHSLSTTLCAKEKSCVALEEENKEAKRVKKENEDLKMRLASMKKSVEEKYQEFRFHTDQEKTRKSTHGSQFQGEAENVKGEIQISEETLSGAIEGGNRTLHEHPAAAQENIKLHTKLQKLGETANAENVASNEV
jgi:conjugal transfer/entry exclusion protein